MILTCPNCGTQYVVKDGAVPPEGRQVRCAACKHSWHQDPEAGATAEEVPTAEPERAPESEAATDAGPAGEVDATPEDESLAEATIIEPRSGPEAEERTYQEAVIEGEAEAPGVEAAPVEAQAALGGEPDVAQAAAAAPPATAEDWNEPPHAEPGPDMFSPFAENGEVEPRRRSPLIAVVIIALIVIFAAAAFWLFAPLDLKARLGLAAGGATPLVLVKTHMDLQQLESGNQLLTVTGRVINPTNKEQEVPPLQAQLKNPQGKVIYTWTIAPPARSLPAGASASFNSAEVNVPPGGKLLTITPGAPKT